MGVSLLVLGCGDDMTTDAGARVDAGRGADGGEPPDAGDPEDAGIDAGVDAGPLREFDAGVMDAGARDAGAVDAGDRDAGAMDAGAMDAGNMDAGARDAGPLPFDAGDFDGGGVSFVHTFPARDFACASSVVPCPTTVPVPSPRARTVIVNRDFAPRTVSYGPEPDPRAPNARRHGSQRRL